MWLYQTLPNPHARASRVDLKKLEKAEAKLKVGTLAIVVECLS
jgi:hypothetical protein